MTSRSATPKRGTENHTPGEGVTVNNQSTVTITGNVKAQPPRGVQQILHPRIATHRSRCTPRFTLGLKGEMDWLLDRKDIAPRNLIFALATVRYNIVPSRAKAIKSFYEGEMTR